MHRGFTHIAYALFRSDFGRLRQAHMSADAKIFFMFTLKKYFILNKYFLFFLI